MTRKDYETIAGALALVRACSSSMTAEAALDLLTVSLAERLAADNAQFSRARFYAACAPLESPRETALERSSRLERETANLRRENERLERVLPGTFHVCEVTA